MLQSISREGTVSEAEMPQLQNQLNALDAQNQEIREDVQALILKQNPEASAKDTDYVFISFILHQLPVGLVGLLLAVILCAAMSSISSELNALATTSVVRSEKHTSELQSLMRISYAVFCLKKKKTTKDHL